MPTLISPHTGNSYNVQLDSQPTDEDLDEIVNHLDQLHAQNVANKPAFGLSDTLSGAASAVGGLRQTVPAAFQRLKEGLVRPDKYSAGARAAFDAEAEYAQRMQDESMSRLLRGGASSAGDAFRSAGPSLGFSGGSMAAAIPAGLAGTALGGPVGGVAAGMAASGAAAYRMAGAQFLDDAFTAWLGNNPKATEADKEAAYQELLPLAQNSALWEAGPEAIGNAVGLGAGKVALGLGKNALTNLAKTALGKAGVKAGALAAGVGTELATETATQLGQGLPQAQAEAFSQGKDMRQAESPYSIEGGAMRAFEDVAPQTLAMSALMLGGGSAVKGASMLRQKGEAAASEDGMVDVEIDPAVKAQLEQLEQSMHSVEEARAKADTEQAPPLQQAVDQTAVRSVAANVDVLPATAAALAETRTKPFDHSEANYQSNKARMLAEAEAQTSGFDKRNKEMLPEKEDFGGKFDTPLSIDPASYTSKNGVETVNYVNPETGIVDVYISAFGNNDFIAYMRQYDSNGQPTNRWTSKLERRTEKEGATRAMLTELQSRLPEGHEYSEDVSVSTDGLRFFTKQLGQGYQVVRDKQGKPETTEVAISGESVRNDLPIAVDPNGKFENIRVTNKKDFEKVQAHLGAILEKFGVGLGTENVRWANGTVFIDLPVLQKTRSSETLAQITQQPQIPTPNEAQSQAQVQETSRPALVESEPVVAEAAIQVEEGTPQRESEGQEGQVAPEEIRQVEIPVAPDAETVESEGVKKPAKVGNTQAIPTAEEALRWEAADKYNRSYVETLQGDDIDSFGVKLGVKRQGLGDDAYRNKILGNTHPDDLLDAVPESLPAQSQETPVLVGQTQDGGGLSELQTPAEGSIPAVTEPSVTEETEKSSGETAVLQRDPAKPEQMTPEEFETLRSGIIALYDESSMQPKSEAEKKAEFKVQMLEGELKRARSLEGGNIRGVRRTRGAAKTESDLQKELDEAKATVSSERAKWDAEKDRKNAELKSKLEKQFPNAVASGLVWPAKVEGRDLMMNKVGLPSAGKDVVREAVRTKRPVSADAVDAYGIALPEGYVREGDLYVYRPPAPSPAPAQQEPSVRQEMSTIDNDPAFNRFVSDLEFYGTAKFGNSQFTVKQSSNDTFYVEKTTDGERSVIASGFSDLEAARKSAVDEARPVSNKASSTGRPATDVEKAPERRGASFEAIASGSGMSVEEARRFLERKSDTGEPLVFGRPWGEISGMQQQQRPQVLRAIDKFKAVKQIILDINKFKIPVNVLVADVYGLTLPEGYTREGDLYVYRQPAEAGQPVSQAGQETAVLQRDPTKPEQMTPEELSAFQKQEAVIVAEEALRKAKKGEEVASPFINGFKSKAALIRAREAELKTAVENPPTVDIWTTVVNATDKKVPVSVALVEALDDTDRVFGPGPGGEPGGTSPSIRKQLLENLASKGYVREGDLYVYRQPAPAPATEVAPTPSVEAAPVTKPEAAQTPPAEPPPPEAPAPDAEPPPPPQTTRLANETTNQERIARGEQPLETPEEDRYPWAKLEADVREILANDPRRGIVLVDELNRNPRAVTSVIEGEILLQEKEARIASYDAAVQAYLDASADQKEAAYNRMTAASAALNTFDEMDRKVGTRQGQTLAQRKKSILLDYSPARMEMLLKGALGRELTEAELRETRAASKDITSLEADIETLKDGEGAAQEAKSLFEEMLKEVQEEIKAEARNIVASSKKAAKEGKTVGDFFKEQAEAARKRIRQRGGNLNVGLNPMELFDRAVIAASYIADGVTNLVEFTKRLVKEFGSTSSSDAETIFQEAQTLYRAGQEAFTDPEQQTAKSAIEQLQETNGEALSPSLVYQAVKEKVKEKGVKTTLEEVFKELTQEVQEIVPEITERKLRDMFSGYGRVRFPSQEEIPKKVRELRSLAQKVSAIEDALSGKPPLRSGPQRDEASLAVREATKELHRVMKQMGVQRAPGPRALKTALDAAKARLKNQIEELEKQIKEGKRAENVRKGVEYDTEAKSLEERRDRLKKTLDEIDAPKPPTAQDRITARLKDLDGQIADLKKRLQSKDFSVAQTQTPITEQIQVKTDERDALNNALREVRREIEGDPVLTQEEVNQRAERNLSRQIDELERQIKESDFTKPDALRPEASVSLTRLQLKRDALTEQRNKLRDEVLGKKVKTDAELIDAAVKSLEKSIDTLNSKILEGDTGVKGRAARTPEVAKVKNLRAERDSLNEVLKQMRKAEAEAKKDPVAEQIKADGKHLDRMIKMYEDRIRRGDFRPRPKKAKEYDKSLLDKQRALRNKKEEWAKRVFEAQLASRTPWKKLVDAGTQTLNTSRAILTSLDLSGVLRQGGFITLSNPLRAAKNIIPMLEAFVSKKASEESQIKLEGRSNYDLYKRSGLYIAETDATKLSTQEEAFMSRWIDKIPTGAKGLFIGSLVRGSQRSYITFLNNLRADTFDSMLDSLQKGYTPTKEEIESIANYVNIATGRGDLGKGKLNQAAQALNTVFFAPRLVASRFQLLSGYPVFKASGRTKQLVLREYGKFLVGASIAYALGMAAQGEDDPEMELDPRSSDFLKLRYGDTRVDLLAGLIQATVFVSRIVSGERKKGNEIVPLRKDYRLANLFREVPRTDKVPYGASSTWDIITTFTRSKFSPAFGASIDLLDLEDVVGQDQDPANVALKMTIPMSFGEMQETLESHGVPKGAALTILMVFGAGVQTYNKK